MCLPFRPRYGPLPFGVRSGARAPIPIQNVEPQLRCTYGAPLRLLCSHGLPSLPFGVRSGARGPAPIRNVESQLLRKGMIPYASMFDEPDLPPGPGVSQFGASGAGSGGGGVADQEQCPLSLAVTEFHFLVLFPHCIKVHRGYP